VPLLELDDEGDTENEWARGIKRSTQGLCWGV
jgi:hypothetical protein